MQNEHTQKDMMEMNENQGSLLKNAIPLETETGQEEEKAESSINIIEDEKVEEEPGYSVIKESSQEEPEYLVESESMQEEPGYLVDAESTQEEQDYLPEPESVKGRASAAEEKDKDIVQEGRTYAGFFARLTAFVLDHLFLLIPVGIVRLILWFTTAGSAEHFLNRDIFFRFSAADMILYAVPALYFIILTYITGRTIGKRIMRLKVVSTEERKPSFLEILFRETFGRFLSGFILCIGYLMIIIGDEKEALHDYLADTRVIYR